jgi:integration host factor subunit beta
MKKSQLIDALHAKYAFMKISQIEEIVDAILASLTDALTKGKRIEIRGFGALSTRERNVQKSFPKDGEELQLVRKKSIYFRMGKDFFDRLNDEQNK